MLNCPLDFLLLLLVQPCEVPLTLCLDLVVILVSDVLLLYCALRLSLARLCAHEVIINRVVIKSERSSALLMYHLALRGYRLNRARVGVRAMQLICS